VLLEVHARMLEPVADVGVGREVEDRVASGERVTHQLPVQDVSLDELDARPLERVRDELAPSPGQVVVEDDLDTLLAQAVRERAPDHPAPAGDQGLPHGAQSSNPAERAEDRNIWTVSREYSSRSLPRTSSFAISSCVIVMMWQP